RIADRLEHDEGPDQADRPRGAIDIVKSGSSTSLLAPLMQLKLTLNAVATADEPVSVTCRTGLRPDQRLGRPSLTRGNIGGSHTPGNHTAETALCGWGERTRTQISGREPCI